MQEPLFYSKHAYDMIDQYDNWCNLLDLANSVKYGFSQYRLPKPGEPIDVNAAIDRTESVDKEWAAEHHVRGNYCSKPSPGFSNCPIEFKCYLHSVLYSVGDDMEFYNPFYM